MKNTEQRIAHDCSSKFSISYAHFCNGLGRIRPLHRPLYSHQSATNSRYDNEFRIIYLQAIRMASVDCSSGSDSEVKSSRMPRKQTPKRCTARKSTGPILHINHLARVQDQSKKLSSWGPPKAMTGDAPPKSQRPSLAANTSDKAHDRTKSKRYQIAERMRQRFNLTTERSIAKHVRYGQGIGKGGMKKLARLKNQIIERKKREEAKSKRYNRLNGDNLISTAPFVRLVRQIFLEVVRKDSSQVGKISSYVVHILLEASTSFLTRFFEQCSFAVTHAKRVTLMPKDICLTLRMDDTYTQLGCKSSYLNRADP